MLTVKTRSKPAKTLIIHITNTHYTYIEEVSVYIKNPSSIQNQIIITCIHINLSLRTVYKYMQVSFIQSLSLAFIPVSL